MNWVKIRRRRLPLLWPYGVSLADKFLLSDWDNIGNDIKEWANITEIPIKIWLGEVWVRNKEDYLAFILRWG